MIAGIVFGFRFAIGDISGYDDAMSDERKRRTGWLTATAVVLVLLGAYVGAYLFLGKSSDEGWIYTRAFPPKALHGVYRPMAMLECRVRDKAIVFCGREGIVTSPDGMPEWPESEKWFYPPTS